MFPCISVKLNNSDSLVTDLVFDSVNACVELNSVRLHCDLLLDQSVDLLLQEVALIDVVLLKLLEVFLEVSDVLNDFLQDVVCCLSCMML